MTQQHDSSSAERQGQPGTVFAVPEDLEEGLFGGVLLFMLELLPRLAKHGIRPAWEIDTANYGPLFPAILTAVPPLHGEGDRRSLVVTRREGRAAMGTDFEAISSLWGSYFQVSDEVLAAVDDVGLSLEESLGVHYRGGDKLKAGWDTNPIARRDFIGIVEERILEDDSIKHCLIAGDDAEFITLAKEHLSAPVSTLPAGAFHKSAKSESDRRESGILAMRDCMLLSRCRAILCTSSALPAFAKVLRPEVDCRRCAASKWFGEVPYFPIAYIPVHNPSDAGLKVVVEQAMKGDWSSEPDAEPFRANQAFFDWDQVARNVGPRRFWRRLARRLGL